MSALAKSIFPVNNSSMIQTPRLLIDPFTPEDAEGFFKLSHNPGFALYPINDYRQKDTESARQWIESQRGKFAVREISSDGLIGMGGLTPWSWEGEALVDITYRLRDSAWGRGLGMELARALVEHGFSTLGLGEITATITPDNLPSLKIAERLGMKFDRVILLNGITTQLHRLHRP